MSTEFGRVQRNTNVIKRIYWGLNYKQRRFLLSSVLILLLAVIVMIAVMPNNKVIKPYEKTGLVVNGTVVNTKTPPLLVGLSPLVAYEDIKQYVDANICYDDKNQKVIITTSDKVVRIKADKTTGYVNNKPFNMNVPAKVDNGICYVPIEQFKDIYNIDVKYYKEPNVVVIDIKSIVAKTFTAKDNFDIKKAASSRAGTVSKVKCGQEVIMIESMGDWYKVKIGDKEGYVHKKHIIDDTIQIKAGIAKSNGAAVRTLPSKSSPIYKKTKKGENIAIYAQIGGWYKVRTSDGVIGFVKKGDITKETATPKPVVQSTAHQVWKPQQGRINMVWDQIESVTPSMDNVDKVNGLDVVSPTWFEVINSNGKVKNKASKSYTTWARANGYKVWAVLNNGVSTNKTSMTSAFLNNAAARENAINEVISYAQTYEIDGINIDFEYLNVKDKDVLTQFMRELEPLCRDKGLTLSIDVTVIAESDSSKCFDRKALSEIADYVIVMAYDQHWSTSPESGSTAEYAWVEENIKGIMEEIPAEKFILGIPFYTRQWRETAGDKPVSTSLSMANVQNIIRQYNSKVEWREDSGQNYTEFYKNNAKYKIWIEDSKSINLKSSLSLKYSLAGVAGWRRGYETPDIWGVLYNNMKEYSSYDNWKNANTN